MKKIINGHEFTTAATIDAIGLFCPMPIIRLKLEIDKINLNELIELKADDPAFEKDLKSWCNETGNKISSIEENNEGIFTAYIEKLKK